MTTMDQKIQQFRLAVEWKIQACRVPGRSSSLRPGEAIQSILTLGFFPLHAGPSGLIRFLPAVFAIGIGRAMSRRETDARRLSTNNFIRMLGTYAALSVMLYALSWIAGIMAMTGKSALEASRDSYNILVSAQVYGYWTMGQVERFAFAFSRQAENGLLLLHAALLMAGTAAIAVWMAVKRLPAVDALFKRLTTRGVVLYVIELCIGASLGTSMRGPRSTYTDAIALLVFLATALCWLAWWRFRRDLDCIARDERERPSLPLPSGAIAPHDLESVCLALLLLSGLGAFLLGWQSFVSLMFATAAMWTFSRSGENPSAGVLSKSLNTTAVSIGFGFAGLGFGLRENAPAPWMASIIVSSALVIGQAQLFRHLRDVTESRITLALGFTLAVLVVLLCGGASVLGLLIIPFALGMLWVARSPGYWHRFGEYPFYIVLGFFAFFALFLPKMLFPAA